MFDLEKLKADLVGQTLTEELLKDLEGHFPEVRHKKPGYCYTMEMRYGRLNIVTDADDTIEDVTLG